MKFFKIISKAIAVIVAIGGILAYTVLFPRISLYPSTTLNPNDPFQTPFILKNDGTFPIYGISARTIVFKVQDMNNNSIDQVELMNGINRSSELRANDQTSLDLSLPINIFTYPLQTAHIEVTISFKPAILYWEHKKSYKFDIKRSSSGETIWFPVSY